MSQNTGLSIRESEVTWIGERTRLEGDLNFSETTRVFGTLSGRVKATPGSTLILMESSAVEGTLDVDTLVVAGFVRGDIKAGKQVVLEGTGRVLGNIHTPSLRIEFGAYFEGESSMPDAAKPSK